MTERVTYFDVDGQRIEGFAVDRIEFHVSRPEEWGSLFIQLVTPGREQYWRFDFPSTLSGQWDWTDDKMKAMRIHFVKLTFLKGIAFLSGQAKHVDQKANIIEVEFDEAKSVLLAAAIDGTNFKIRYNSAIE